MSELINDQAKQNKMVETLKKVDWWKVATSVAVVAVVATAACLGVHTRTPWYKSW